jgi:hypothetical protein
LTFGLKHKAPTAVRNLDNFIFIFEDVPRQKDFSRVYPKETRIMSAAHSETVSINSGWPCGISAGFLIDELCADRATSIDIELFQVRSHVSHRPPRREYREQRACWLVGRLLEEYPASTMIDRRQVAPSGARNCGPRAIQIRLFLLMKQH